MIEEWRSIIGHEGYFEVSNFGNIRGIDRYRKSMAGGKPRHEVLAKVKGKKIKPFFDARGRPRICLRGRKYFVSVLVAQNFLGYKKTNLKKYVVNHIDNNPSNNLSSNLEWVTQKTNIQHSIKQGRHSSVIRQTKKNTL